MSGGKATGDIEEPAAAPVSEAPAAESVAAMPAAPVPAKAAPASLVITQPVRSGQSFFAEGDVTIIGSVASGAEVIAGGSIHIYGTLRGRAMAGTLGNGTARIFCRKLEAELVAIDGFYRTAEDLEPGLRGKPAQFWLDGETFVAGSMA